MTNLWSQIDGCRDKATMCGMDTFRYFCSMQGATMRGGKMLFSQGGQIGEWQMEGAGETNWEDGDRSERRVVRTHRPT